MPRYDGGYCVTEQKDIQMTIDKVHLTCRHGSSTTTMKYRETRPNQRNFLLEEQIGAEDINEKLNVHTS